MKVKSSWLRGGLGLVCLVLAGCGDYPAEPTALSEEMIQEMRVAPPVVGGPSQEFSVEKSPADITPSVQAALKDSGISLVQEGGTDADHWLLGKSLADRRVLVQMQPVYPGRSSVKITVEGGDSLTRDLLARLANDIGKRVR